MTSSARLTVRVTPRAGRDEITGVRDGVLQVRLKAPPVEGAANAGLERFLARQLSVAQSDVAVVMGLRSRTKQVVIQGLDTAEVERRLELPPG